MLLLLAPELAHAWDWSFSTFGWGQPLVAAEAASPFLLTRFSGVKRCQVPFSASYCAGKPSATIEYAQCIDTSARQLAVKTGRKLIKLFWRLEHRCSSIREDTCKAEDNRSGVSSLQTQISWAQPSASCLCSWQFAFLQSINQSIFYSAADLEWAAAE